MLNRLDIEKYIKQLNAVLKQCDASLQQIPVAKMAKFKFLKVHRNLLVEHLKEQAKSKSKEPTPLPKEVVLKKLKSSDVIDAIRKEIQAIYSVHAVDLIELGSKIQAALQAVLKKYPLDPEKELPIEAQKTIIESIKKILIEKFEIQIIDTKEIDCIIQAVLKDKPKDNKSAAESIKTALMKAFNIVDKKKYRDSLDKDIKLALQEAGPIILGNLQSLKAYDAMVAELSLPIERLLQENYYVAVFFAEKLKTPDTLGKILDMLLLDLYVGFKQPVYGDYNDKPTKKNFGGWKWEHWKKLNGELRGLVQRDYIWLVCEILNRPNHPKYTKIAAYAEIIGKFCEETKDADVTARVAEIKKYIEFTQFLLNKYKDNKETVDICRLVAKDMDTEENSKLLPAQVFWNKVKATPALLAELGTWEKEYNKQTENKDVKDQLDTSTTKGQTPTPDKPALTPEALTPAFAAQKQSGPAAQAAPAQPAAPKVQAAVAPAPKAQPAPAPAVASPAPAKGGSPNHGLPSIAQRKGVAP